MNLSSPPLSSNQPEFPSEQPNHPTPSTTKEPSNHPVHFKYQIWDGRNTFWKNGRLLVDQAPSNIIETVCLLFVAPIVLFAHSGLWFYTEGFGPWGLLISGFLCLMLFASFISTFLTNPGFIPRRSEPEYSRKHRRLIEKAVHRAEYALVKRYRSHPIPLPPSRYVYLHNPGMNWVNYDKEAQKNGFIMMDPDPWVLSRKKKKVSIAQAVKKQYLLKYCETCHLYRPIRSSHCSWSNNCVPVFDHTCGFLSSSIGERNYKSFFVFICTATLIVAFVITSAMIETVYFGNIEKEKSNSTSSSFVLGVEVAPWALVLSIIALLFGAGVSYLTLYHIGLVSLSRTTREEMRSFFTYSDNPFSSFVFSRFRNLRTKFNTFLFVFFLPVDIFINIISFLTRPEPPVWEDYTKEITREEYEQWYFSDSDHDPDPDNEDDMVRGISAGKRQKIKRITKNWPKKNRLVFYHPPDPETHSDQPISFTFDPKENRYIASGPDGNSPLPFFPQFASRQFLAVANSIDKPYLPSTESQSPRIAVVNFEDDENDLESFNTQSGDLIIV